MAELSAAELKNVKELALKKLRKARITLLVKFPFWGLLAMRMQFIASESAGGQRTTAVDEHGRFFYNPEWINNMTLPDVVFEVAHEIMHIVQQCITRFPPGGNHARWNLASDYVVDTILTDADIVPSEVSKKMVTDATKKKVRNKTTEQVYYSMAEEDKGKPQQSQQPGLGDEGPTVPDNHHHSKNNRGCATSTVLAKKMSPETVEKFKQHIIAAAQAAKDKGNAPGFVGEFLAEIARPTITWKDQLKNLTASCFKGRYTYKRPNRREITLGLRLPTRAPKKQGAIVMIDTSGSISDSEINQFISECVGIMNYCGCPWIKIYLHDVNCYHSELYSRSTIIKLPVTRGGTSHVDVFDKVLDNEDKIGCIVAFTDLYTNFPTRHVPYPVVWAHPESGASQDVPFGNKVLVKLGE